MYPLALTIVAAKSEGKRIQSIGKPTTTHFQKEYDGRPILLCALYQKGAIRPDCLRMLQAARDNGMYIVGVNTLRLSNPEAQMDVFDCYIEKFNFGRDFSSYKAGFQHIFRQGWHNSCQRLVMINDSTFFARDRVKDFFKDLLDSDIEVLGSTENYEIEYHLGSFCISMSGSILRQKRFQTYWKKYRLSDIRPVVIYRGEMKLSRTLKRCASSASQFQALYSTVRFHNEISRDTDLSRFALITARTSALAGWPRLSAETILEFMESRFIEKYNKFDEDTLLQSETTSLTQEVYVETYEDVENFLNRHLPADRRIPKDTLHRIIIGMQTEVFMRGSQVHQNATVLLKMGLPLVKLDGLYRGMFNLYDLNTMELTLHPEDVGELRHLILQRPYGGDVLFGWKSAAFRRGLI